MPITGERMPALRTMLAVVDESARDAVRAARRSVAPVVARETPRRSGKTAAELRPRTVRSGTGYGLVVGARRARPHGKYQTVAQVVKWVSRGTGEQRRGPGPKAPITAARPWRSLIVGPGGVRRKSVAGQRPNPFMDRIRAVGTLRVQRAFQEGAVKAARDVERVID